MPLRKHDRCQQLSARLWQTIVPRSRGGKDYTDVNGINEESSLSITGMIQQVLFIPTLVLFVCSYDKVLQ